MSLIPETLYNDEIIKKITTIGEYQIYLVGGAVRDFLLNKKTYDYDIIVTGISAKEFSQIFAQKYSATLITLDEINNIYRVVLSDKINYIDITNPINNDINDDLYRRDLSINAIAIDLNSKQIIDNHNGIADLKLKQLKIIDEKNLIDDPLRLLRIFRFSSILGFEIDDNLLKLIRKHSKLINKPAKERILYEIMKLFGGKYADKTLLKMYECGILSEIFPITKEIEKVPANSHHHLDLIHHSIETVRQIQIIYETSENEIKNHLNRIDFGGFSRLTHLKLAGYLHDIGKFSTWTIENGRHRFIKHDDVGAKLSKQILKQMNFSNKQIDYISYLIKNHIYPSSIVSNEEINDKIMMRFVRKSEMNAIDNIVLAKADRYSARGIEITEEIIAKNISGLDKLQKFYLEKFKTLKPLPKLLDGNEIMQILNIKADKNLGIIINKLQEEQLNGEITTKEEAINFIKKLI